MTTTNTQPYSNAQPRGFFIIYFTEIFLMFGFATCNALLTLYVSKGLGFSDKDAYALAGAASALMFASQLLGGYLAGRYWGYIKGLYLGCLAVIAGFIILITKSNISLYLGLTCVTLGFGHMVPSITCLLSQLYLPDDYRRNSGFTLIYAGYNIGALASNASTGYIQRYFSYEMAFIISAIAILICFIIFKVGQQHYERHALIKQDNLLQPPAKAYSIATAILLVIGALVVIILKNAFVADQVLIGISVLSIPLLIILAFKQQESVARNKLLAFILLLCVSVVFWSLYMIEINCLPLFNDRNVDRHVFNFILPASSLMSFNSFFVITLGPVLSIVWLKLSHRNRDLTTPHKFSLALILMGLGYIILTVGIAKANTLGFVAILWVILSYFFQTTGELFIGPIGPSMIRRLVPQHLEGIMQGVWALSTGVAGALSGYLAQSMATTSGQHSPLLTNPLYSHTFLKYGMITVGVGILLFICSKPLQRLMGED